MADPIESAPQVTDEEKVVRGSGCAGLFVISLLVFFMIGLNVQLIDAPAILVILLSLLALFSLLTWWVRYRVSLGASWTIFIIACIFFIATTLAIFNSGSDPSALQATMDQVAIFIWGICAVIAGIDLSITYQRRKNIYSISDGKGDEE